MMHLVKLQIILICGLISGCVFYNPSESTQAANTQPATNIPISETATSFVDITATPFPVTEQPVLSFEEARKQTTLLLQSNGNCQLPCWWGITPGVTTRQEAFLILAPLGGEMSNDLIQSDTNGAVFVRPPAPTDEHKVLFQTYYLESGVVTHIEVYNYDYAPFTHFKKLISDHGIPDEMYIRGHRDTGFRLALFYPNQGVFAEYSHTITSSDENNVRVCFEEANFPFVYLWASNQPMTFEEAVVSLRVPTEDIPAFVSVEEAVINLNEFILSLSQENEESCIETPKELWPTLY